MKIIQHNHPHSGKRYSYKTLTDSPIRTGSTYTGTGIFSISGGLDSALSDKTAKRTLAVEMTEDEAVQLAGKIAEFLAWCETYRRQAAAYSPELANTAAPASLEP